MHVTKAPFDDNNVRMAMKLSMDRDELNEKIFFNAGTVGNDFHISPNMPYYPDGIDSH